MIRNKFVFFTVLASIFCTLYSATAVSAVVQTWSMNAMACQPSQETIEKNIMAQVWGRVKFQKNKTGKIVLFCPVSTNPQSLGSSHGTGYTVKQLSLTFLENNGQQAIASVSAALRYVAKEGNSPPVTVVEINTDSPNTPDSGSFYITKIKPKFEAGVPGWGVNHPLNITKNFYYIQITIERTLPGQSIGVKGVSLSFG